MEYLINILYLSFRDIVLDMDYTNTGILVSALNEGNILAFEYIYKTYYKSLLNYASRILKDVEASKDAVQQAYYRLWENRSMLTITIFPQAYLYRAVYNNCINSITRKDIIRKYEEEQLKELYFSTIIQTPEAEMLLERSEIEKAIMISVEALPKKCQEIFILSKMEGLKNKEIAERLGISLKTVESQMTIAIKRLRKDLGWLLQIFIFFRLDF